MAGVTRNPKAIKVIASHGRLLCLGPAARALEQIPGAAFNERHAGVELSLTLETFGRIKSILGLTSQELAARCDPKVMKWARMAAESEAVVNRLHAKLATGWRLDFEWPDRAGHPRTGEYRPPFEHQKIIATAAASLDGIMVLAEQGTSKTRAVIAAMDHKLKTGECHSFVVAAPKRALSTWVREINMYGVGLTPVRPTGTVKKRAEVIASDSTRGAVYIVNYDVLNDLLSVFLQKQKIGFIPDESHFIRNSRAARTKAAMKLAAHSPWRVGMTGTPIGSTALDVWSQWYVCDLGITFGPNLVQFRREHFHDPNPYTFEEKVREGALESIGVRMQKRGLRFLKKDCLDLPPKVWEVAECEMVPEQARAYKQMAEDLLARLDEEGDDVAVASTQLVSLMKLAQITGGFVRREDGTIYAFEKNPKLDLLEELVREHESAGQSVIVWARYRHEIEAIMERFKDMRPGLIYGGVSQKKADDSEARFQSGETKLMVCNAQSAGVALTLTQGSYNYYYSQDYDPIARAQSEDRTHRPGAEQHEKITYIDLVVAGTIDEAVRQSHAMKKELRETVVDLKNFIRSTL